MDPVLIQRRTHHRAPGEISLTAILEFIRQYWKLILPVVVVAGAIGFLLAISAPPVYRATAVVRVDMSDSSAPRMMPANIAMLFDAKSAPIAELEMLRTRSVVLKAVDGARLDITANPKRFPVIGEWLARRSTGLSDPGLFGAGGYAWRRESIKVDVFEVPKVLEGEPFLLTVEGDGQFKLTQSAAVIGTGRVGEELRRSTPQGEFRLVVESIDARPGIEFVLGKTSREEAAETLLKNLNVVERAKQSGVIAVSLEGTDPVQIADIVNEISRQYIQQNIDLKAEEAERSLAFLDTQLPDLRASIEAAEARYSSYRNTRGTADVGEEVKAVLQQQLQAQVRLGELRQRRADLTSRSQNENPVVDAVNQQIRAVTSEIAEINEKIKRVPGTEQQLARLTRDVRVNTELYASLLNTAQQLRLAKASRVGSAKLIDPAVPMSRPVGPKRGLILVGSLVVGLILAVFAALLRKAFASSIENYQDLARAIPLPLVAVIPHSKRQARDIVSGNSTRLTLLAEDAAEETAVESLRTFRATLDHLSRQARNNVVMFAGPTAGVGKSFIAANFSVVLAHSGKRVLLIDGDLRGGRLHAYFGLPRGVGLGEMMLGQTQPAEAIHANVIPGLSFLSTGALRLRSGDALATANVGVLLSQFSSAFDHVVIDTAPVLAVADALALSNHVGLVYCVARKGLTSIDQLMETSVRFAQSGHEVDGVVFNDAQADELSYAYGSASRRDPMTAAGPQTVR